MQRQVVLLRGVNLARRNRISMPELRTAMAKAGFGAVATYVQSGNVVVSTAAQPDRVATIVRELIKDSFGLDIVVLVRTRSELAEVVRRNPLADVARDPRRYLVTFLSSDLPHGSAQQLAEIAALREPFAILGREVYSWHPPGVGRSPLWERLAARSLGVAATSRNWVTVVTLLAMAETPVAR